MLVGRTSVGGVRFAYSIIYFPDLGFRTNRYMGVRDSDRIPARRGGFEGAARFPNSASVALQTGTESELLPFCLDSVLFAKWVGAALTETFPGVGAGGTKEKKTKCLTKGANSISFPTSSGYKSVGNVSPPSSIPLANLSGGRVGDPSGPPLQC